MDRLRELWARNRKVHLSALGEVLFTLAVSNAALAISVFIIILKDKSMDPSWGLVFSLFGSTINAAEVLVYLLAIVAPTLWYMVANVRVRKHLKGFGFVVILQTLLLLLGAVVYALEKTGSDLNQKVVVPFAWLSFVVVVIIWYSILVFQKNAKENVSAPLAVMQKGQSVDAIKKGLEDEFG